MSSLAKIPLFFYALVVALSWWQLMLLLGAYSPVGIVLTASSMPYLPPLSVAFLAPAPPGGWEGWGVRLADAQVFGVPVKLPLLHYYICNNGGGTCTEVVPNSKSRLGATPLETLAIQLFALIPPYPAASYAVDRAEVPYRVVLAVPAYVFVPLMAWAVRLPPLYYKFRRVW